MGRSNSQTRPRASDNIDVGDVERVGNEFIVVRQGVAKIASLLYS